MLRTAELALAGLTVIVMLSHSADAERQDIKVRYYAPCVLKCSDNVTQPRDVRMFWILPDAVAIDHTTDESRLPTRLRFVNPNSSNELNITRVDDDQFGYYTCVMINASTGEVMVTQWGVNIDGADFSALEAEYRSADRYCASYLLSYFLLNLYHRVDKKLTLFDVLPAKKSTEQADPIALLPFFVWKVNDF